MLKDRGPAPDAAHMQAHGLRSGHLMSLAGAAAAIGSLWAPWYKVDLTVLVQTVNAQADQLLAPSVAQQVHANASLLPPSVSITAWQAFHRNDILIAALAGLVVLIVIAASGALGDGVRVDPYPAARACSVLGALCAGLVVLQLMTRQGARSGVPSTAVQTQWGGYVCLAAAGAMLIGGLMATSSRVAQAADPPVVDLWAPPAAPGYPDDAARAATSIAPPGLVGTDVG